MYLNKMKILVVAPTPFFANRGTHIRILEESLALEKLGHKITIATYHIGSEIDDRVKTEIDLRRIRRLLFWYKKLEAGPDWQKIILDLMLVRKVFNLARKGRPDILHCHLHEGVLIGWIVKIFLFWRKMKIVCDFHGSLTKEMVSHSYLKRGLLKSVFKRVEFFIDNLGDFAITSSWENTEEIRNIRSSKNVETVLDGVNLDYYRKNRIKENLKKELEFPMNKIILTYTGALVSNKGTKYLFEAIEKVLKKNKNVFFVIGGFPIEEAENFIIKNNFEKDVRLISPLNYFDLPEILSASDAGIDPKDSETRQASGKILQYMGAGLPVICFDRKNNREYLGEGGIYSQDISGEGLAKKIFEFCEKKEKLEKMGELNRKRVEKFSWENSARKISDIYQNLFKN
jgi:glycosyltransferase involved in cell wall biosynthesis